MGTAGAQEVDHWLRLESFSYRRSVEPDQRATDVPTSRSPLFVTLDESASATERAPEFRFARRNHANERIRQASGDGVWNSEQRLHGWPLFTRCCVEVLVAGRSALHLG